MSTIKVDIVRPVTADASLTLQGDNSGTGVSGLTIDSSGNTSLGGVLKLKSSGNSITASDGTSVVLSESSSVVTVTANNAVIEGSSSGDLVRITQTGSGNALVVEDSTNPDSTPFVVDSSGNLLVGVTSGDGSKLNVKQTAADWAIGINATNSGTQYFQAFRYDGVLIGSIQGDNSNTSYLTASDYRLKENITNIADGISRVKKLNPSRFNFIADPDKIVDGFIAHEVQDIVPEAITGEKDAVNEDGSIRPQGIDQSKLIPLLTAALQKAITLIESQQSQIDALNARIEALETT